ncbi:hypothetical protein GKQ38_00950 [Candidatus Nanohaloarchaea archaeon]|nr:hypothetical protein GKQ38_00950 [Candidatus Nanohaloarchaea archaeon]
MLFDNRGNSDSEEEEVSISPADNSRKGRDRGNEARVSQGKDSKSQDSDSDSSSGSGIAIPSAEGDGNAVDESKVTLEDIHEQNERIIQLLESIPDSDVKNTRDTQDDSNDKLKGDIENELL